MAKIEISKELCKGCNLCILACPFKLISKGSIGTKYGTTIVEFNNSAGKCTGCKLCAIACPDAAIDIYK